MFDNKFAATYAMTINFRGQGNYILNPLTIIVDYRHFDNSVC